MRITCGPDGFDVTGSGLTATSAVLRPAINCSSVIVPSEDNRSVLAMWAGATAPQPPTTTFGPGCRTGHPLQ